MKLPWRDKTGLAKAAAILATVLMISLGLCGANFVAVIGLVPMGGGSSPHGFTQVIASVLTVTSALELLGIAGSILGLIVVAILALIHSFGSGDPPPTIKGDD